MRHYIRGWLFAVFSFSSATARKKTASLVNEIAVWHSPRRGSVRESLHRGRRRLPAWPSSRASAGSSTWRNKSAREAEDPRADDARRGPSRIQKGLKTAQASKVATRRKTILSRESGESRRGMGKSDKARCERKLISSFSYLPRVKHQFKSPLTSDKSNTFENEMS